jgi:hypothetical protein
LCPKQGFQIREPEARQPILMLNNDPFDRLIGKQFLQLRSLVVHTGADLFHNPTDLITFGFAIKFQAVGLSIQIRFIFRR